MSTNTTPPPSTTTIDLSALAEVTEMPIGPSSWLTIDQARIDGFADVTGDHQWIHTDPSRAVDGPFGTTIAHGYLTLSLVPQLLSEIMHITNRGSGVNYGMDRIRFLNPVPVNSRIRLVGRILRAEQRGSGVRCQIELQMDIEGQDKPAMLGEFVILALP